MVTPVSKSSPELPYQEVTSAILLFFQVRGNVKEPDSNLSVKFSHLMDSRVTAKGPGLVAGPARASPRVWVGVTEGPGGSPEGKGDRTRCRTDPWDGVADCALVRIAGQAWLLRAPPAHSAPGEGEQELRGLEGREVALCDSAPADTCH